MFAIDHLQLAWSYKFGDVLPLRYNTHRLAFGNGLVYATNGHDVVALDAATGNPRWRFDNLAWLNINDNLNDELHAAQSQFTSLQPVLSDGVLLVNMHQAKAVGPQRPVSQNRHSAYDSVASPACLRCT